MLKALLFCAVLLCSYTQVSAQHILQLDAGGGKIALLSASVALPIGTTIFTLPEATSILISTSNVEEYAWVLGGNSSPFSSNDLGTLTNNDLNFITGASGPNRRMRITASGAVQIGSAQQFEVAPSGNLVKINGLGGYSWPGAHTDGFLKNDGSGGLSWVTSVNADRSSIGNWYEVNVGSGTTNQIVDVAGAGGGGITEFAVPFAGSITGIAVTLENDCNGGSLTCEVLINGIATGLIATVTDTGGAADKYGFIAQATGLDNFSAGDRIQVRFSTTAGYGANGDAYFTVYGNF
jgi:hypothetical protein